MGTSSIRRRRVATAAATLSIALAGAAWSGCGDDQADQVTDAASEAIDNAQNQADELSDEAQNAIDDAQQQGQEAQDAAEQAIQDAQQDSPDY